MIDDQREKELLEGELKDLRRRVAELETLEDEHRRVVQALGESEEWCRLLVQHTQDSIFILQGNRIKYPNPFTIAVTGYTEGELANLTVTDLIHPDDRNKVTEKFRRAGDGGQAPGTFSFRALNKKGDVLHAEINAAPISWEDKPAFLCLVRDITAQTQLDTQLQYTKKMEAIGTLAGGIAHDFNNYLQGISGYIQLLMMKKDLTDREQHYLMQMEKSVERAALLTKQLLIFGRKEESKLRPVNLNEVLHQAYKLLIKTLPETVHVELDLSDYLEPINADAVQFEHIMFNMGLNAKDAMPEGGKFRVETRDIFLDEKYCDTHVGVRPGAHVQMVLTDTGHGMDPETLEHIFEPFYTTKGVGMGTGLGLSIVYGIVQSHNGHITCETERGKGTTFRIYFPALESATEGRVAEPERDVHLYGGETILLVDDETNILDIGVNILEQFGYTTLTARSGEEAVDLYRARGGEIGLVILDLGMPGMGGEQCLQEILKINPKAQVVIASGYAASQTVKYLMEAGASGYVSKPYRLENMLKKIRELIDKK
ncbi:MAG: PAS domain S-box protein [Deltaproteobacteria bacterium]|nr:PAS domain S-box protein [Deltaproteobacteria bacterium]